MEVATLTARLEAEIGAFMRNLATADAALTTTQASLMKTSGSATMLREALKGVELTETQAARINASLKLIESRLENAESQAVKAREAVKSIDIGAADVAKFVAAAKTEERALKDVEQQALKTAAALELERAAGAIPLGPATRTAGFFRGQYAQGGTSYAEGAALLAARQRADAITAAQTRGAFAMAAAPFAQMSRDELIRLAREQRIEYGLNLARGPGGIPLGPSSGMVTSDVANAALAEAAFRRLIGPLGTHDVGGGDFREALTPLTSGRGRGGLLGMLFGAGKSDQIGSSLERAVASHAAGGGDGGSFLFGGDTGFSGHGLLGGVLPGGRHASAAAVTTALGILTAMGPAAAPAAAGLGLGVTAGGGALLGGAGVLGLAFRGLSEEAFKTREAFMKLTPEQQRFVTTLRSLDAGLGQALSGMARGIVLPGITGGLRAAITPASVTALTGGVSAFSGAVAGGAREAGNLFGSTQFARAFGDVLQADARYLRDMIRGALNLTSAFIHLQQAAIPLTDWMDKGILRLTEWTEKSVRASQASGGLAQFFNRARVALQAFGGLLGSVGRVFGSFFDIVGFEGSIGTINTLGRAINVIARTLRENRRALHDFFMGGLGAANDMITAAQKVLDHLSNILSLIDRLVQSTLGWRRTLDALVVFLLARFTALRLGLVAVGRQAEITGGQMAAGMTTGVAATNTAIGRVAALRGSLLAIAGKAFTVFVVADIISQMLPQGQGKNPVSGVPILGRVYSAGEAAIQGALGRSGAYGGTAAADAAAKAQPGVWVDMQGNASLNANGTPMTASQIINQKAAAALPRLTAADTYAALAQGSLTLEALRGLQSRFTTPTEYAQAVRFALQLRGIKVSLGQAPGTLVAQTGGGGATGPAGTTGAGSAGDPFATPKPLPPKKLQDILPLGMQEAIARASTTAGTGDDTTALKNAISFLQGHMGSFTPEQRVQAYNMIASFQSSLKGFIPPPAPIRTGLDLLSASRAAALTGAESNLGVLGAPGGGAAGFDPRRLGAERVLLRQLLAAQRELRGQLGPGVSDAQTRAIRDEIVVISRAIGQTRRGITADLAAQHEFRIQQRLTPAQERVLRAQQRIEGLGGIDATTPFSRQTLNAALELVRSLQHYQQVLQGVSGMEKERLRVAKEIVQATKDVGEQTEALEKRQAERRAAVTHLAIDRILGIVGRVPGMAALQTSLRRTEERMHHQQELGLTIPRGVTERLAQIHAAIERARKDHEKLTAEEKQAITAKLAETNDILKSLKAATPSTYHLPSIAELMEGLKGSPAVRRALAQRLVTIEALGGKIPGGPAAMGLQLTGDFQPFNPHPLGDLTDLSMGLDPGVSRRMFTLPGRHPGLVRPGNLDLLHRQIAHVGHNIATVRSISVGISEGKRQFEVLLPTIINGVAVSTAKAIAHFRRTGENLGIFDTPEHADAYASALHMQQARFYGPGGRGAGAQVVHVHGDLNLHGVQNPEQLARQLNYELQKSARRNATQTRGPNAGRNRGLN